MGDERRNYDATISRIETIVTGTEKDVKEIHDCIYKDNGGLKTKVALNGQSIKRAWWFIAALATTILGTAAYVVRGAF